MRKQLQFILLLVICLAHFDFPLKAQTYSYQRTIGEGQLYTPTNFTIDKQGFLYVVDNDGYILKMDTNRSVQLVIDIREKSGLTGDWFHDIAIDGTGNIWITDLANSRVLKFDPTGRLLFTVGSKGSADGQFYWPYGITVDHQGNIWISDTGNNRIQKFDPNGKFLFKFGSKGSADGQFDTPHGIAVDSQDNLWIVDAANFRVQKFDPSGTFLLKFGSQGAANGRFDWAKLYYFQGIAIDNEGNALVTDTWNNRIQKFDQSGNYLSGFGSRGSGPGYMDNVCAIALDRNGTVWVGDYKYRIQRFDAQGRYLAVLGMPLNNNYTYDRVIRNQGVATDSQNNIWVVDHSYGYLKKYSPEGTFLLQTGSKGTGNGQFKEPYGIATDAQNNLWAADAANERIQKFDPNGKFLSGFGSKGFDFGQFIGVNSVAVDARGNIWTADTYKIQKFDSTGKFLFGFDSDGSVNGKFYGLTGLILDKNGNLWVGAKDKYQILKFDQRGRLLQRFGRFGVNDGQFRSITGMAIDKYGNIWVADTGNSRVQVFNPKGEFAFKLDFLTYWPKYLAFDKKGSLYATTAYGLINYSVDVSNLNRPVIQGRIYADNNGNCIFDPSTDKALSDVVVVAKPGDYYAVTDTSGTYQIQVDTGTYVVSELIDNLHGKQIEPVCQQNNASKPFTIANRSDTVSAIDFANKVTLSPYLQVSISSNRRRRCFANRTLIRYSNTGYQGIENVQVHVKLPAHVIFQSADKPYVIDSDSSYVFTIGALQANQYGTIQVIDSVACLANLQGLTACTKVWITPSNTYTLPADSDWDQSDIRLTGKCIENGRVQLVIKNNGQSMADSSQFRILLNGQLAFVKNYQLAAADSLMLRVPAGGKTIRLEADQRDGHPRKAQTNLTIEGCVASSSDIVSKGFVDLLPQDDVEDEVAIECLPIVDSFDPNDKLVSPQGTTSEHYTPTSSEFKYTIRFQNTGSDTAYTVTVIDTLSEKLDISTLQQGASSHAYAFNVSGKTRPVLTWKFANINLPDSTRNQAGSNGFVQFSIRPKAGLSEKARIENFADIIFDYNEPVRTNTTVNVLYDVSGIIDPDNQLSESIIDRVLASEPHVLKGKLSVYPNPTRNKVQIQSVDASVRIEQIQVSNLLGELQPVDIVRTSNQAIEVSMQGKAKGMYLIRIQTSKGTLVQRLVVQ